LNSSVDNGQGYIESSGLNSSANHIANMSADDAFS
jgi:hypothetical protein